MNRDGPLKRYKKLVAQTGLGRGKGIERTAPLERGTGLARTAFRASTTAARKPLAVSRPKPVAAELRAGLLDRCGWLCESCGQLLPEKGWHAHHRLRVAHGRIDSLSNLVALHPLCHVNAPGSVHRETGWALKRGLLVRSTAVPAQEPLWLPDGHRVWLTDDVPAYLIEAPAVAA